MKRILLPALLALNCFTANCQRVEVGVHGGYGTTWLLNKNVSDQGDNLDYAVSFAPVFGLHAGYIFPSNFGVVLDLDYAVTTQKYTGKSFGTSGSTSFNVSDKLNYFDIPVMLRKYSKGGDSISSLGLSFPF